MESTANPIPEVPRIEPRKRALPPVHNPIPHDKWEQAKGLRLAGNTWSVISKQIGLKESSLKTKWRREGMDRIQKRMDEARLSLSEENSQKCEKSIEDISRQVRQLMAADSLSTAARLQAYEIADLRDESVREQVAASLVKRSATVLGWADASANVQVQVGILASLPDREQIEQGPTIEAEAV